MTGLEICNDLSVYNSNPKGGDAYLKYLNPSRLYTTTIIQDDQTPAEALYLHKIAVSNSEIMSRDIIYNLYAALAGDKDKPADSKYLSYSLIKYQNSDLFYSFNYLTDTPEGMERANRVSPTCQFLYKIILADAMRWLMYFPIDNTMTCSKINAEVLTTIGMNEENQNNLPQMIWAGNNVNVNHTSTADYDVFTPNDNDTFNIYSVMPIDKKMTFNGHNNSLLYLPDKEPMRNNNDERVMLTNNPVKANDKVFD